MDTGDNKGGDFATVGMNEPLNPNGRDDASKQGCNRGCNLDALENQISDGCPESVGTADYDLKTQCQT